MKKVITLCGFFIFLITLSKCRKKDETTPEKCTPPSPPYSINNGPLGIGDTLKFTTISISGATYSWKGPNDFTSNLQNPSLVYSEKAMGEYLVTATVNGCTSEAYHNYVTNTNITATSSVGTLTTKTLSLHASDFYDHGFTIPATYNWKGPNGFNSTEKDPTITNVTINATGTYSVTATAISNDKKSNEATTTVSIIPIAISVSSNSPLSTPVSVGATLNLIAPSITGATSYSWTGPNGFTSNLQNPSINNVSRAAAGTYYFYYTLNNIKSEISKTIVGINYSNSGCNGQASVTYKGVTYNTIEIGNQCWLKENLRNNSGTADSLTWDEMNTATVVENQGACPTGWHLPDDNTLKQLAIHVNGDGNQLKKIGQGIGAGTGTNTSGFSALLEIRLTPADSTSSIFWSTTQISSAPRYMQLFSDTPVIYYNSGKPARKYNVRCLKD